MWNKFNTKQQTLPIQKGDILREHFENLYNDIPINQIKSDQCIIKETMDAVLKLFSIVLWSGCFPDIWCKGLMSPIYKSGDKSHPNN